MYQGKFNNSSLHSTETQNNLAIFPFQKDTIEITISLYPSTSIVSAGTVTLSAVNLIYKSFSFNENNKPKLPWYYLGTRLKSDSFALTLNSGSAVTQSITSVVTTGEINCLLVSFVSSTNCTKTSISQLKLRINNIDIYTLNENLSITDSTIYENEELGSLVQMLPQSNTNPFYIIPLSLLPEEISNVGSSGLNAENEKAINLIVTSSANVTYTMYVSAVYKQFTMINENGKVTTSL